MSAGILDGRALAQGIKEKLKIEIEQLKQTRQIKPSVASIVVGHDPASLSYALSQQKTAESLGIYYKLHQFEPNFSEADLLALIHTLNTAEDVHGIIVNKPLPPQIDFKVIINAISPLKDIEGMTLMNYGLLLMGQEGILPCTPAAALELLKSSGVALKGKHAVVIGRSEIVGKPAALLLLKEDMTVTVCHSKTANLEGFVKEADVVFAAIGRPNFVKGEWLRLGAVVIDIGINHIDGKLTGDVHFESACQKASFISPVPGGVGPVTAVLLMQNVLKAFKMQTSL